MNSLHSSLSFFAVLPVAALAQTGATLDVAPSAVLNRQIQTIGDRSITIEEIRPPQLLAVPPTKPSAIELVAKEPESAPDVRFFLAGATVYHSATHPLETRTLLHFHDQESKETIVCWSSADWNWLTGIAEFSSKEGQKFAYMLSLSNSTVSDWSEITKLEKSDSLPAFTPGKAEFVVVKGTPSALALAPIQAAHDFFNAQGDQLKADFEARERVRLAQQDEAAAKAALPKKLIIRHWRIDPANQSESPSPQPSFTK